MASPSPTAENNTIAPTGAPVINVTTSYLSPIEAFQTTLTMFVFVAIAVLILLTMIGMNVYQNRHRRPSRGRGGDGDGDGDEGEDEGPLNLDPRYPGIKRPFQSPPFYIREKVPSSSAHSTAEEFPTSQI